MSQTKSVKATVIIPTKNPGSIFHEVINSVLSQATDFEFDVIVIDSGSESDFLDSIQSQPVKLIEIEPSSFGHGKTRNLGIETARSEYVVLITHDSTPKDDTWLRNLVNSMDSNPNAAGGFGRHDPYADCDLFTVRNLSNHFEQISKNPISKVLDWEEYAHNESLRQRLHFFSNNNSILRKSIWDRIPFPDVEFAEDQQWAKLVIEAGLSTIYISDAVVLHSHNYSVMDNFRRAFDESKSFRKYFGYRLGKNFLFAMTSTLGLTIIDLKYGLKNIKSAKDLKSILRMPVMNASRSLGHYFGTKYDINSTILAQSFSYDRRLFSGRRKGRL